MSCKKSGIFVNDNFFSVHLAAVVCDAPARAFVKCVKGHSGYYACERCTQEGAYFDNKMTFPDMNAPARTNQQFLSAADEDHQLGISPLVSLGIGCVSQFPLDYMHLVCLGVVRRMIFLWLQGPKKHGLGTSTITDISQSLLSLRNNIPSEFCRRPRSLFEVRNWKATEFRQFLLYSGPIVLAGKLPQPIYRCFMLLSVALRILLSEKLCQTYCDYADELLRVFVKNLAGIYGQGVLVYNVHSLVHLAQDARKYGALDNVSSFPYENYLGQLKRQARKAGSHVSELVRRIAERERARESSCCEKQLQQPVTLQKEHREGPLPAEFASCCQYKRINLNGYVISCKEGDNCCEVNGSPVIIHNILRSLSHDIYFVYEDFMQSDLLFSYPLQSSAVGIKVLYRPAGSLRVVSMNDVGQKCALFRHKDSFIAVPFIHHY